MDQATTNQCQCGCGARVARRFLPGHDAKLKGRLLRDLRTGDWRAQAAAADELADRRWTGHVSPADLRPVPHRTSRGGRVHLLADLTALQVTPSNTHHADRRCPSLTAEAKAAGALRVGGVASDSFVQVVENTPELQARLLRSWDQCTTCTTDTTRDEEAEAAQLRAVTAA